MQVTLSRTGAYSLAPLTSRYPFPSLSDSFPTRFHRSRSLLSTDQPNMTAVPDNHSSRTSSESRLRRTDMQFLTPTPSGFEPEYDYLSTLKALSEAQGFDTATKIFSDGLTKLKDKRSSLKVSVITSTGSTDHFTSLGWMAWGSEEGTVKQMYYEIRDIRQTMKSKAQQKPCVLMAETHGTSALQILGTALDLEPEFLIHHMMGDSAKTVSDVDIAFLSKAFSSCVVGLRKGDVQHLERARLTQQTATTKLSDSHFIQFQADYLAGDDHGPTPSPSRISCCQISAYSCESSLSGTRR
jgi:hypothetical protein